MKIKIKLVLSLILICSVQFIFPQEQQHSTGAIPIIKMEKTHTVVNTIDNPASIAYGHNSQGGATLSMPIPAGTPWTTLGTFTAPNFASSMVKGGDGNYYLTDITPILFLFNPVAGTVTQLGSITGTSGDQIMGISYNPDNNIYYLISTSNFYSFNVTTRIATFIGSMGISNALFIDLCFTEAGVCYAYDLVTDAAYTINPATGVATLLGPLGYDANFGQGMSYDMESGTIYLSAFNNSTFTGQLRTMIPSTGATTLITDWGLNQLAPFALDTQYGPPCPVGAPSNPNPPNGATDIPISGNTLSWANGTGTTYVELWFGPAANVVKVYDGSTITSFTLPTLNYNTNYRWYVVCKDATCGTQGPIWSFTTLNDPFGPINVYPQNANYWTGTCNSSIKTQVSLVNAIGYELGWMVFDISPIPDNAWIESVTFYGYLYANNWPYWSITPMGNVNPVTDYASAIYNQVSTHYQQGVAYSYNQESGTLNNGWLSRELSNSAEIDLSNALSQDWFAIGIVDWDFSTSYYIMFRGWAQADKPYLSVAYWCWTCYPIPPSNLTAQVIFNPGPQVQLNWQDNSSNENGFNIFRKFGYPNDPGNYELIGTVQQNITQYLDTTVTPDSTYTYRVFSYNGYGSSGSNTATITIPIPVELISFTCEIDNDVVKLLWQTATETNNSGFEIERARLRSSNYAEAGWERIGFVEGKGTTTEIQSYSFIDKPEPGKYKYRLKQIDYDGSFAYSQEIEAEVKAPNVFSLEQNYPNPFNPTTKIKYNIPFVRTRDRVSVQLKVYDILGNEVATLVNEEKAPGVYEVEFSVAQSATDGSRPEITSGVYFYQLKAGEFIQTRKMILLK